MWSLCSRWYAPHRVRWLQGRRMDSIPIGHMNGDRNQAEAHGESIEASHGCHGTRAAALGPNPTSPCIQASRSSSACLKASVSTGVNVTGQARPGGLTGERGISKRVSLWHPALSRHCINCCGRHWRRP